MTEVDVLANAEAVQEQMAAAAARAERDPAAVSLTIVSKTFEADRVLPLLNAGYRVFGENRVQEAIGKWGPLKAAYPDTKLHLIGSLQTNKAADAVAHFDVIEVLDREKLARAMAKAVAASARTPEFFVQVNTGEEPQKGGLPPAEIVEFVRYAREDLDLSITGLMTIPPAADVPAPHFELLRQLAGRAGVQRLSMGMSADFEVAINLGATDVRVGSGILGPRAPKPT